MEPGTRVTMKEDRRTHYGTVIEGQYRKNDGITFVRWDRDPENFQAYRCAEVREVRTNEESDYPEGSLETTEDFIAATKRQLSRLYIDENGNVNTSRTLGGEIE